jgi:RecA-family ATPase
VFAGSEIDRSQVRQFVNLLTRLAIAANGTTLLITHPSLTGITSGTGLSGSTQWHNSVRARAVMRSVKPTNGEAPSGIRQIDFHKHNYGPPVSSLFVSWQAGMFLPVDGVHSLAGAERIEKAEQVFVALLRRFIDQKQPVGPSPGKNYAPTRFAQHPDAHGLTSKELAKAMQRLLDAKTIEVRSWGSPSRPNHHLAFTGEGKEQP